MEKVTVPVRLQGAAIAVIGESTHGKEASCYYGEEEVAGIANQRPEKVS